MHTHSDHIPDRSETRLILSTGQVIYLRELLMPNSGKWQGHSLSRSDDMIRTGWDTREIQARVTARLDTLKFWQRIGLCLLGILSIGILAYMVFAGWPEETPSSGSVMGAYLPLPPHTC